LLRQVFSSAIDLSLNIENHLTKFCFNLHLLLIDFGLEGTDFSDVILLVNSWVLRRIKGKVELSLLRNLVVFSGFFLNWEGPTLLVGHVVEVLLVHFNILENAGSGSVEGIE